MSENEKPAISVLKLDPPLVLAKTDTLELDWKRMIVYQTSHMGKIKKTAKVYVE